MKKKIHKYLLITTCLLGGVAASITPLFLTSCSQIQSLSTSFRVINMSNNKDERSVNIKNLNEIVNIPPKDLVKGTNSFNNGKYIIIYGTLGYDIQGIKTNENNGAVWEIPDSSAFYKWLIGATDGNGVNTDEINRFEDFEIKNDFFNYWFNDNTNSQYRNVKIALFIDKPPYPSSNVDLTIDTYCPANPFETWTQDMILTLYKYKSNRLNNNILFEELPENWQMLEGTYMRNDESAKMYRDLVNYSNDLRSQGSQVQSVDGSSNNQNSGIIAFNGVNNNPMTISLSLSDYKPPFDDPSTVSAPDSWKKIYKFYVGEDWPEDA